MSKFVHVFNFLKILILFDIFHFYYLAMDISLNIILNYMNVFRDDANIALE